MTESFLPFCTPTSPFLAAVSDAFHTCIPTPLALVSISLGSLSVLIWLFAQLPQVYKNYRLKSTAGLSFFFVLEWFCADFANLLGAVLTRQAGWQVLIGAYFFCVDVTLLLQFCLYTYSRSPPLRASLILASEVDDDGDDNQDESITGSRLVDSYCSEGRLSTFSKGSRRGQNTQHPESGTAGTSSCLSGASEKCPGLSRSGDKFQDAARGSSSSQARFTLLSTAASYAILSPPAAAAAAIPTKHTYSTVQSFVHAASPISLLLSSLAPTASPSTMLAGTILSWASAFLYLLSRLPQLHKNYTRKSTTGLSPLLFLAAFCGNLTYSTSILTNPNAWHDFPPHGGHGWADSEGTDREAWIYRALPFWLGAAGTLFIDGLVGLQFVLYDRVDGGGFAASAGGEKRKKQQEEQGGDDVIVVVVHPQPCLASASASASAPAPATSAIIVDSETEPQQAQIYPRSTTWTQATAQWIRRKMNMSGEEDEEGERRPLLLSASSSTTASSDPLSSSSSPSSSSSSLSSRQRERDRERERERTNFGTIK